MPKDQNTTFLEYLKALPTIYQADRGHLLKVEQKITHNGLLTNFRIWLYDSDNWSMEYYYNGYWYDLTTNDISNFIL